MMPSLVLQRTRSSAYTQREIGIEGCPHVEGRPELAPLLALTRVGTMDYWCQDPIAKVRGSRKRRIWWVG